MTELLTEGETSFDRPGHSSKGMLFLDCLQRFTQGRFGRNNSQGQGVSRIAHCKIVLAVFCIDPLYDLSILDELSSIQMSF